MPTLSNNIWTQVLQYLLDLKDVDWRAWVGEVLCGDYYGANGPSAADIVQKLATVESVGYQCAAVCKDVFRATAGWKEVFPCALQCAFQAEKSGGRITKKHIALLDQFIQVGLPYSRATFSSLLRCPSFRERNWGVAIKKVELIHSYGPDYDDHIGHHPFSFEDTIPAFSAYAHAIFDNIEISWGGRESKIGCWSFIRNAEGVTFRTAARHDLLNYWHSRGTLNGRVVLLCRGGDGQLLSFDGLPLVISRGPAALQGLQDAIAQIFPGSGHDALQLMGHAYGFSGNGRPHGRRTCGAHSRRGWFDGCQACTETRAWFELGCYTRLEFVVSPPGIVPQKVTLEIEGSVAPFLFVSEADEDGKNSSFEVRASDSDTDALTLNDEGSESDFVDEGEEDEESADEEGRELDE